jgi:hypothetical protein
MGIEVEKEHAGTYQWIQDQYKETGKFPPAKEVYEHISLDHLKEGSNYYTLLAKMEKELEK